MVKLTAVITRVLILVYILFGVLLFVFQAQLLYYPTAKINHGLDTEMFSVENESIEVIVLNKGHDKALLYFGGNGEAVEFNANNFMTSFPTHTVYLVNYRGFGGSSGKASEQALYFDAQTIFDKLNQRYLSISVIGRSLGSGIATMLASKNEIDKLVLITPYDSIERVAQSRFSIYPMSLMLKEKYKSLDRVKDIKADTLIVIAENDSIIPFENSARLTKAFPPHQVSVEIIKNTNHNSISGEKKYYRVLHDFLAAAS